MPTSSELLTDLDGKPIDKSTLEVFYRADAYMGRRAGDSIEGYLAFVSLVRLTRQLVDWTRTKISSKPSTR